MTAIVTPTRATIPVVPQSVTTEPPAPTPTTPSCITPSVVGTLNLLPLSGVVREPTALAMFQGRVYVAGQLSHNIGVIENDQLTAMFPVGEGPTHLVADESLGKLFVLNAGARTVALTDGQQVQATLPLTNPVGTASYITPISMIGDPQNHRLFVGVEASQPEVVVIDAQTFSISARIALGGTFSLGALALDAAANRLFVSQYDTVSIIDLASQKVVETFKLPGSSYRVLQYDAVSRRLYAEYYDQQNYGNYIAVLENGKSIASARVGADPSAAAIINQHLYVTNSFSSTISVIDLQGNQPTATLSAHGLTPRAVLADPQTNRVYVSVVGNFGHEFNRVMILDEHTHTIVREIPLSATPQQLIADNTRKRLYALLPSSNEVVISDGSRVLSRVGPLGGTPFDMALNEASGKLYIADYLERNVMVVDATTAAVVGKTPVNTVASPVSVAVDNARHRLLVNNRAFALDSIAPTGAYSITGYTVPYGDGITPDRLLVNPSVPRFYVIAANGVPGSNGGVTLYLFDSEALKQLVIVGDRNVSAFALDDAAQRVYETATHPLALTTKLSVFDALNLNRIASLDLPARVTALALNPQTHHLFMSYLSYSSQPNAADNSIEVLDTRTLGRVGAFPVGKEPSALAALGDRVFLAHGTENALTIIRDCASDVPPAPTPTRTPTPYPTFPPLPTFTPTPTPSARAPSATPVAAKPSPQTCANAIAGWAQANFNTQSALSGSPERLGCPLAPPHTMQFALQAFQNGLMIWRADTRKIYVLNYNNTWAVYDDMWDAIQPEGGTETPPAANLRAPKRGFGKVWREKLGGANRANEAIGWAVETERSLTNELQDFQRGIAVKPDPGFVGIDVLFADGTWV